MKLVNVNAKRCVRRNVNVKNLIKRKSIAIVIGLGPDVRGRSRRLADVRTIVQVVKTTKTRTADHVVVTRNRKVAVKIGNHAVGPELTMAMQEITEMLVPMREPTMEEPTLRNLRIILPIRDIARM